MKIWFMDILKTYVKIIDFKTSSYILTLFV